MACKCTARQMQFTVTDYKYASLITGLCENRRNNFNQKVNKNRIFLQKKLQPNVRRLEELKEGVLVLTYQDRGICLNKKGWERF